MNNKYSEMLNNKTNGNLTDFRNQLRKLTKLQLVEFIAFWKEQQTDSMNEILRVTREAFL